MEQEVNAAEAAQIRGLRPVVVRKPCATNTIHAPGDIVQHAGPLPANGIFRELTEDELDEMNRKERARLAEIGADANAQPPRVAGNEIDVRGEVILEALGLLDATDDSHWLESGQPAVAAVNGMLLKIGAMPETTTRAEIKAYASSFIRPPAPDQVEAPSQGDGGII